MFPDNRSDWEVFNFPLVNSDSIANIGGFPPQSSFWRPYPSFRQLLICQNYFSGVPLEPDGTELVALGHFTSGVCPDSTFSVDLSGQAEQ